MHNHSSCHPAIVNVAFELLKQRGLRVVEAWIALRENRRLASVGNDDAPYDVFLRTGRNLGHETADARSQVQESGHSLPSSYHHFVQLAAVHGTLNWPLVALASYAEHEPAAFATTPPAQVWANALAKYVMRLSKLRDQRRALYAQLEQVD